MRVTFGMMFDTTVEQLQQRMADLLKAQETVATGKKIQRPSDAPIQHAQALGHETARLQSEQYRRNIQQGLSFLNLSDSVLAEADRLVIRARELALAQANGVATAQTRAIAATEVNQIIGEMVRIANTQFDGRYIFAGYLNGTPPFDAAGNYSGDSNPFSIQADAGVTAAVTVTGDRVFKAAGGIDIFAGLGNLETALNADNLAGIQTALGDLDQSLDQLTNRRAELGARINRLTSTEAGLRDLETTLIRIRSDLEDADMIEAASLLVRQEQALQFAREAAARAVQPSLLDFIR